MAAIIGLPDDAGCASSRPPAAPSACSPSPTATPPARSWSAARRAAVEAAAEAAKGLGAKRAIVLPVSVAAHSPLMARAAEGMRAVLADVDVQRSARAAAGQRRRAAADHRRSLPRRARRAPDPRRRLGRGGRAHDRAGRRLRSSKSAPARCSPASSSASRPTLEPSPSTTPVGARCRIARARFLPVTTSQGAAA